MAEPDNQQPDAWTAYDENLDLTATCVHLREIEHAMRLTGIRSMEERNRH